MRATILLCSTAITIACVCYPLHAVFTVAFLILATETVAWVQEWRR